METIKCVLVGANNVGKTCSLISYTTNYFPEDYVPTVFDNYSANVMVDGKPFSLGLWDTAGQDEYDRLRPLSYPQTDIFLVMFDVGDRSTLDSALGKFVNEIQHHCPNVPKLLVANKIDLDKRQVSREEGERSSRVKGFDGYFEVSARTQQGLKNIFDEACRIASSRKADRKPVSYDSDASSEAEEETEWDKKAREVEDPFPEKYKFGIYLIDQYGKTVEDKFILKTEVASYWKLLVALVKKLRDFGGKKDEEEEEEEEKKLVANYFDDNQFKIYIEDPDFKDFFLLDSFELLKEVGEKSNNNVKLQLVGSW
ncbi:rho family small GTPase [Naegleria gruberi]|uniref:Rho family small GTPase n=1 Tax=Naegleria gruberi TaxID=5762 RepID=D2V8C6_NAEGR|nr:rho family small GTPase [Naegleria gruberi]EFC47019.1 rho family small GTPase [Naegleria gruberi]|eukprot:XP_002679763.1 rho family small GTPase [Naegleria gruberi strain NEG-M]